MQNAQCRMGVVAVAARLFVQADGLQYMNNTHAGFSCNTVAAHIDNRLLPFLIHNAAALRFSV